MARKGFSWNGFPFFGSPSPRDLNFRWSERPALGLNLAGVT